MPVRVSIKREENLPNYKFNSPSQYLTLVSFIYLTRYSLFFWSFFFFLGSHLQYMEVPRLRVKWELQLPAYTTATATQRSELCLHFTPQLIATLDPQPQGQGSNLRPHGY